MKHLRIFLILTFISLLIASCTDGAQMRQQLADLQTRNQADSLLTDDSLALTLCDYFDSHGTSNERLLAHYLLARTYTDMGEAPRALDEYHRAAECADTTVQDCDYLQLAKVHGQMAELLYQNQLPRNSLNAYQQAYRYSMMADEPELGLNAYAQQGKCYYDLSLPDSAMFITEEAIHMLFECGDTLSANSFKGPVAYGLIDKGELPKAKEYLDSYEHHSFITEDILQKYDDVKLLYIYKGYYFQHAEVCDSALFYYYKALHTSMNPNNQALAYRGLYQTYELLHELDSVSKYAALYVKKNDETVKLASSSALLSMQYLYEYQSFKTLAQQKSLEAAQTRQSLIVLSFSLIMVALLSCGVILYLRNRQRLTKQRLFTKYTADMISFISIKKELQMLQSQSVINEHRVMEAKKELEIFRQSIIDANKKYSDIDSWGMADAIQKVPIVIHLKKKGTKGLVATEQELQDLRKLFKIYHPAFVESLNSTGYTLSIKEFNICLLIKLNFAPSEICALLKVGNSALSNQRSRLLKKMFGTEGSATQFDEKIKSLTFDIGM